MLAWLAAILPGVFTTLGGITSALANAKIAAITASTDQARIAAEEQIASLDAQRDVLIEDSKHSKIDLWVRTFIALGPTYYLTKVFIWDKSWGLGTTDNLSEIEWQVVMVVVGFYFVHSVITRLFK